MSADLIVRAVGTVLVDCPRTVGTAFWCLVLIALCEYSLRKYSPGPAFKVFAETSIRFAQIVLLGCAARLLCHASLFASLWR